MPFKGQIGIEDASPGITPRFGRYDTPYNGIRAAGRQVLVDYSRRLTTIPKLINSWAPAQDRNDTNSYSAYVCSFLGVEPKDNINMRNPPTLAAIVTALIHNENGRCIYDNDTIAKACQDAVDSSPVPHV